MWMKDGKEIIKKIKMYVEEENAKFKKICVKDEEKFLANVS